MSTGTLLRALRQERGLTQQELAQAIRIDTRRISLYENDKMLPSTEVLKKLASFFNVSTDYLLQGELKALRKVVFQDSELLQAFMAADRMPATDREVIKAVLQAFIIKNKIRDFSELSHY